MGGRKQRYQRRTQAREARNGSRPWRPSSRSSLLMLYTAGPCNGEPLELSLRAVRKEPPCCHTVLTLACELALRKGGGTSSGGGGGKGALGRESPPPAGICEGGAAAVL